MPPASWHRMENNTPYVELPLDGTTCCASNANCQLGLDGTTCRAPRRIRQQKCRGVSPHWQLVEAWHTQRWKLNDGNSTMGNGDLPHRQQETDNCRPQIRLSRLGRRERTRARCIRVCKRTSISPPGRCMHFTNTTRHLWVQTRIRQRCKHPHRLAPHNSPLHSSCNCR